MIIATAGHVDHGKSTLVRRLTGTDPDRWAVERDRGLTVGQVVTTGSYAGAITVPLGQPLTVAFGDLGSIAVELIAAD